VRVKKWLLKHLKVLRGIYIAWYVLWQTVVATVAVTWLTLVGFLLHKLYPLSKLPAMIPFYMMLGIGLALIVLSFVGLIIVLATLSDNWWKWNRRAIFRRVRNRTWDLEYDVQEEKQKRLHQEAAMLAKLAELKNATWEV
jgi:hypothetical protein